MGGTQIVGKTKTSTQDVSRENVGVNYNITKDWSLGYHYFESQARYLRDVIESSKNGFLVGTPFNDRLYTTKQHMAQLQYQGERYKGSVYFTTGTVESFGHTYYSPTGTAVAPASSLYNTREKNRTLGADIQRNWEVGPKAKAILGFDYKRENYQKLFAGSGSSHDSYSRNLFGVYGQWDQNSTTRIPVS